MGLENERQRPSEGCATEAPPDVYHQLSELVTFYCLPGAAKITGDVCIFSIFEYAEPADAHPEYQAPVRKDHPVDPD